MTKDEALKMALEALDSVNTSPWLEDCYHAFDEEITAVKEALAQPKQNEFNPDWDAMAVMVEEQQRMAKRISELEAQQERKPLSDKDIEDLYFDKFSMGELKAFARAIEAAHNIKE